MPVLVGTPTTPVVPDPAASLDVQPWTFVARDGTLWPLTRRDLGYWILRDSVTGLGVAPFQATRDERARGGYSTRHEWQSGRLITFDMFVRGGTRLEMLPRWRALGVALRRGGVLRIGQADGTVREIGVELEPGSWDNHPQMGPRHERPTVQLWCPDGYFRDSVPVVVERTVRPTRTFLAPFLSVSSSRIPGREVLDNTGDVDAWPDWVITGAASSFTATNHTTGSEFSIDPDWDGDGPLAGGETVTITSDPPAIVGPAGQIWWGAITGDPWPLVIGPNDIEFTLADSSSGSRVRLAYDRRFETI